MNGRGRGGEEGKYLTGALNLTSKMVFQLDEGAEILGSLSQADYPIVPALPGYGITSDTDTQPPARCRESLDMALTSM